MSAASYTDAAIAPAQETPATEHEQGYKIFVGNLAYATTDEGLKTLFATVLPDILSVQVIQRGTRPAGYGFVSVKDIAQVEKAVAELHKKDLDGRSIIVEAAKPAEDKERDRNPKRTGRRTAGRRGNKAPPGEVTEAEANGEVPESLPEAVASEDKPKKRSKKTRKPRAKKTPSAENETAATADEAAPAPEPETATETAPRKPKRVRVPRPPRPEGEQPEGEPSKSVLFVANLAFNVDDAALAKIFTSADIEVVSARVVRRRYGHPRRSKGYGFVDVGTEQQQHKALEAFAHKEVNGREIAVKVAVSSPTVNDHDASAAGDAASYGGDATSEVENQEFQAESTVAAQ